MNTITVLELQQQAAAVLERVQAGENLTVVSEGRPVAELRAVPAVDLPPRPRGRCAGIFTVPDDFDAPLPDDIIRDFEGR